MSTLGTLTSSCSCCPSELEWNGMSKALLQTECGRAEAGMSSTLEKVSDL